MVKVKYDYGPDLGGFDDLVDRGNEEDYQPTALAYKCMEFVIWEGPNHWYPKWFTDACSALLADEGRSAKGRYLKVNDYFVQYKNGHVEHFNANQFTNTFEVIRLTPHISICATREDIMVWKYKSDEVEQEDGSIGAEVYVELRNRNWEPMTMPMVDFVELFGTYKNYLE